MVNLAVITWKFRMIMELCFHNIIRFRKQMKNCIHISTLISCHSIVTGGVPSNADPKTSSLELGLFYNVMVEFSDGIDLLENDRLFFLLKLGV